jgi:hypothetical protein
MSGSSVLLSVASWEPRFVSGLERAFEQFRPHVALFLYSSEYEAQTSEARERAETIAVRSGCEVNWLEFSFAATSSNWGKIWEKLKGLRLKGASAYLDISTAPRDTAWQCLRALEECAESTTFIYNRPAEYSEGWLSRKPARPRLVSKLSGEFHLARPTALIATTGFDLERTGQLIRHFSPKRILLGIQRGEQFENQRKNVAIHREEFDNRADVEWFEVDAYSGDYGESRVRAYLVDLLESHNVLLSSLGPKPSVVALYRLQREFPQAALCYAPAREYNPEYSSGIGETLTGQVRP